MFNSIEFSGAETMVRNSIEDFRGLNVSVHCLSTGEDCGPFAPRLQEAGAVIHHVPAGRGRPFLRQLAHLISNQRFDAVHIHCERNSLRIACVARLCGTRVVVRTVHSVFLFIGRTRLRAILSRWLSRTFLKVRHIFISPSVATNETTRFHNTGVVVRNFIDERVYFPCESSSERQAAQRQLHIPHNRFVILSAGSCVPVKRHADILEALAQLTSLDIDVHYVHAGSGPLESIESSRAQELGVADVTSFIGVRQDMRTVYVACDCFVMPSEREGYPMAALEAAACGLPVIAYDVYGLRDAVQHGVTGLLVDASPAALASAVAQLSTRGDHVEMGRAGSARTLTYNSRTDWINAHARLYSSDSRDCSWS